MVVLPTPKPTRKVDTLVSVSLTIVSSREEDDTLKEVTFPRYRSVNCILETKTKTGITVTKVPRTNPNMRCPPKVWLRVATFFFPPPIFSTFLACRPAREASQNSWSIFRNGRLTDFFPHICEILAFHGFLHFLFSRLLSLQHFFQNTLSKVCRVHLHI